MKIYTLIKVGPADGKAGGNYVKRLLYSDGRVSRADMTEKAEEAQRFGSFTAEQLVKEMQEFAPRNIAVSMERLEVEE